MHRHQRMAEERRLDRLDREDRHRQEDEEGDPADTAYDLWADTYAPSGDVHVQATSGQRGVIERDHQGWVTVHWDSCPAGCTDLYRPFDSDPPFLEVIAC